MHHNFPYYLNYISHLSYIKIYFVIIASGHIIPIPESVTLLLLGLLSATGHGQIFILILIAFLATITIDLVLYSLSFMGLHNYINNHYKKYLKKYEDAEEKHLFFLVFFSHFVPGWRLANPLIAGSTGMPTHKFLKYTVISCLIYASVFVSLGHIFHRQLPEIITAVESVHRTLSLLLFGIVIGAALIFLTGLKRGSSV